MSTDQTLSIIKPDAFAKGKTGAILAMIQEAGFTISAMKMLKLSRQQAEEFYAVHHDKGFYNSLVEFMTSGPVVVFVLRRSNAVEEYRKLMGSTDPGKAEKGTIRAAFGENVQMNAVHGSDSPENAARETGFFFSAIEIM